MTSIHNTRSSDASASKPRKDSGGASTSQHDKQYVVNTSHKKTSSDKGEKATSQKKDYTSAQNCTEHWEDEVHLAKNLEAYKSFQETNRASATASDKEAKKRPNKTASSSSTAPNKKHKSNGAHDDPVGAAGSITRVPKTGQKVQWYALSGYVDGEVVEVVYEEKEVEGEKVEASKEDPRVVVRSEGKGKVCVHKPDDVFFE
jgi:hypothetical protein